MKALLQQRNEAYRRWIGTGRNEDLTRFREVRNAARMAIREAKNRWFQEKAGEDEREHFGWKKVLKCIRDLLYGHRGLVELCT